MVLSPGCSRTVRLLIWLGSVAVMRCLGTFTPLSLMSQLVAASVLLRLLLIQYHGMSHSYWALIRESIALSVHGVLA